MGDGLIVVCGWCRTVQSPTPCDHELASINADVLERQDHPLVTHTICPSCARRLLAAAAPEPQRRAAEAPPGSDGGWQRARADARWRALPRLGSRAGARARTGEGAVARFNDTTQDGLAERRALLEELLASADDAWIEPPFHCDYGWNITLGERSFMNFGCVVLDCAASTSAR